jgi:glutamine cyclotransferase
MKKLWLLSLSFLAFQCKNNDSKDGEGGTDSTNLSPKSLSFSIVSTYPHDTSSFTEGLLFYNGELYESAGDPDYSGKSRLMKIDLKTGKSVKSINLDKKYFGEGIVILHDTIYQLTYQEKVGFMYSVKDFKKLGEFTYSASEGWGMTTDGKQIIASDGTSNLYFYEPSTFRLIKTQAVTDAGSFAYNLNELEYIDGFIFANQWQSPYILKIDPNTGQILAKADFTSICDGIRSRDPHAEFFNGIAYDSTSKKIYVTGKRWPELYEIQFGQ